MALGRYDVLVIVRAQNLASQSLRRVAGDLSNLSNVERRRAAQMSLNLRQAQLMGNAERVQAIRTAQLAAEQRQLNEAVRAMRWDSLSKGGRILTDVGRTVRLFGLGVTAAVGAAAHQYAMFNTDATLAATQTGRTTGKITDNISQVGRNSKIIMDGILKQMREFPASAKEMSAAAYDIYSSTNLGSQGLKGVSNGLKLLRILNKAAVAGQVDLSDATGAVTSVMNSYGTSVDKIPKVLQRMFAAVRFGRMTMQEFIGVFSQIVPAGRAANQTLDNVLGSFAAVTRLIPNVRMGATGFARMLEIFGRKTFVEGAKQFGIEVTNVNGRLLQLPDILKNVRTWLDKQPFKERAADIRNFFKVITGGKDGKGGQEGTIQARRVFIQLINTMGLYRNVQNQVKTDNTEFTKSFRVMSETAGVKFSVFINSARALMLRFGKDVLPIVIQMGKHLEDLLNWWEKLDASTRSKISRWIAWAGIFALVGGAVATLVGGLITFMATLGKLRVLGAGLGLGLIAIIATLKIFTGEWKSAGDAIAGFAHMATSSIQGVIVTFGILASLSRRAMASYAVRSEAGATGAGFLPMVLGTPSGVKGYLSRIKASYAAARGIQKEAVVGSIYNNAIYGDPGKARLAAGEVAVASRGTAALRAMGTAAVALPGWLKLAAVALGVVGVASYVMGRKADAAARELARLKAQIYDYSRAARNAMTFSKLGPDIQNLQNARDSVSRLKIELRQTTKELKGLKGDDRKLKILDIRDLRRQLSDAKDEINKSIGAANKDVTAFSRLRTNQANAAARVVSFQNQILRNEGAIERLQARQRSDSGADRGGFARQIKSIQGANSQLREGMKLSAQFSTQASRSYSRGFDILIRKLSGLGMIPKHISNQATQALKVWVAQTGRLNLKDIQRFIRVAVHKGDLSKADQALNTWIHRQEQKQINTAKITKSIKDVTSSAKNVVSIFTGVKPPKNDKRVKQNISTFFAKPIGQPIHLGPINPSTTALGASIISGISATVGGSAAVAQITSALSSTIGQAVQNTKTHKLKAKSPSKYTAEHIGNPIIQGIVLGIQQGLPKLADVATLSVQVFEGPWITSTKFQDAIKGKAKASKTTIKGIQLDIKSAQNEVKHYMIMVDKAKKGTDKYRQAQNNLERARLNVAQNRQRLAESMGKRARTETPRDVIKDLRLQEQAMAQFNRSISTLQRRGAPGSLITSLKSLGADGAKQIAILSSMSKPEFKKYLLLWKKLMIDIKKSAQTGLRAAARTAIKDFITQAKQELTSKKAEIRDTYVSWWDDIFNSSLGNVQDIASGSTADVVSVYQDLFSGPWLTNERQQAKKDWGIPFSKQDLMKDLQQQVVIIRQWKGDLDSILIKSGNADFVAYLKSLGPDAAANIHVLTTMTDAELSQYISMWKEMTDSAHTTAVTGINNVLTPADVVTAIQTTNKQFKAFRDGLVALKQVRYTPDELKSMFPGLDPVFFNQVAKNLQEVPNDLINYLQNLGPDQAGPLLDAILHMTPEQIATYVAEWRKRGELIGNATQTTFDAQIAAWRKQGNNIAAALIQGVEDKNGELKKYFEDLFTNLLKGYQKKAQSHSPSRVFVKEGHNIVDGLAVGLRKAQGLDMGLPSITKPMVGGSYATTAPQGGTNIHMEVHATDGESLDTTLERASFRLRHRGI